MLKVGGKRFFCELCRANVFTKIAATRYRCNGCEHVYEGE